MSLASLDTARWSQAEVVLLDIGKSLAILESRMASRERLQSASTNLAMHAAV